MNRLLIVVFGLLIIISCNDIDYMPKYNDFENAWESDNLKAKVKKLTQYKAYITDLKNGKTENPVIEFEKGYTDFGQISEERYFDTFGKLLQNHVHEYNEKGYRVKSISTHNDTSKLITTAEFNNGGKITSGQIIKDSIILKAKWEYDSLGNLISQINVENRDTTSSTVEYKYNNEGKILEKKQIDDNEYVNGVTKYRYDKKGSQTEMIFKSEFVEEVKTTFEYDNRNRIMKITQFNSGQIEKETTFDKFYNVINVKVYQNGEIHRKLKYKYNFDKKGNWIEREVFMKEISMGNKGFRLSYIEMRDIEYYE